MQINFYNEQSFCAITAPNYCMPYFYYAPSMGLRYEYVSCSQANKVPRYLTNVIPNTNYKINDCRNQKKIDNKEKKSRRFVWRLLAANWDWMLEVACENWNSKKSKRSQSWWFPGAAIIFPVFLFLQATVAKCIYQSGRRVVYFL